MPSLSTLRTLPQRQLDNSLQACPTSLTVLTASKAVFFEIFLVNTNASDRTVTLTDGNAVAMSPIILPGTGNATSNPTGTAFQYGFASQNGVQMTGGIKIQASGAGVNYSIFALAEGLSG